MGLLKKLAGHKAETCAYKAFTMILRSICDEGHGNFIISCKDRIVGSKVKHELIKDTGKDRGKE